MYHLTNKKRLFINLFFSILLLAPLKTFAIVKPTNEFYVNDYAHILSYETEKYIMDKSVNLSKVDGTQIVVVTVNDLEGMPLEDYAYKLFKEFKIGDAKKNNGLLLLLALEERQFRVEVGDGLEGILPDGKTGRFQDKYIIPYLKENKWDEGIKNGYDAFYSEIVKLNNLDLEHTDPIDKETANDNDLLMGVLYFFILPVIGFAIGRYFQKLDKKSNILTIIYLIVSLILMLVNAFFIFHLIMYLIGRFAKPSSGESSYYSGGGYSSSSGGFSSGGSSSSGGGFSGGGGHSSGGGSSRGF